MTASTDNASVQGANIGRGIGAFVMTLAGALWLYFALKFGNAPSWASYAMFAVAAVLGLASVQLMRSKQSSAQAAPRSRWTTLGFFIVFAIEIAAINRAIVWLPHWNLQQYLLAAIAAIVGFHFLPLAKLFRARIYYFTGFALVAWPGIMILLAKGLQRDVFIGLGAGAILWMTALAILVLTRR